jgi:phenylpyruvate tautomerase PptA (4-oxalocrotonate tautomerase family)
MPLVQIDLPRPLFEQKGTQISAGIHRALVDALEMPADDKFQVFRPREAGELVFDPGYGGVDRKNLILIQVLMVHRYTVEMKRELYRHIVTRLADIGVRREDIQIAVTENNYEDWYAGRLHDE